MATKVGVIGAKGRMGSEVSRAVEADPDLDLVAGVDLDDSLDDLVAAGAEVAVDFTSPDAVKENVRFLIDKGIHAVVGTTGMTDDDVADIAKWVAESDSNVFIAPNFAVGAVLMMRFAAQAAPYFSAAEVSERHHENKADAPSGTSLRTAALMNEARDEPWPKTPANETIGGARGADVDGVRVHSLRVHGSVAHQEVVLGSRGETLTIRHDSLDRSSFMPGVLLAIKKVSSIDGLVVGLENLLDL